MSDILSFAKLKASFERTLGAALVYADYYVSKDETTLRIRRSLRTNVWHVYPDSSPESGDRYYSSLQYPTAAAAAAAFARASHSLVYGRDGTPDGDALTQALLQIDPAAAAGRVTGHGMGALEAALLGAKSGEHIVASQFIFGTTKRNLLDLAEERGVTVTFVDGRNTAAWEAAIQPRTRLFLFEPLGNPGMERIDTEAVAAVAHKNNRDILVVADNSMTPFDRSLSKGADIVAFSTTKLLGLGRDNGGAILVSEAGQKRLQRLFSGQSAGFPVLTKVSRKGLTQSHRSAHSMLRQARLSFVRLHRQTRTAVALARELNKSYPTLAVRSTALDAATPNSSHSSIFAIDCGNQERAFHFIDLLAEKGIGIVNNFGSARTTVIHPSTTTQSSLSAEEQAEQGISPGLVRVSVGIERLKFLQDAFTYALLNSTAPSDTTSHASRHAAPGQRLAETAVPSRSPA